MNPYPRFSSVASRSPIAFFILLTLGLVPIASGSASANLVNGRTTAPNYATSESPNFLD
jgi:hypothetical protein